MIQTFKGSGGCYIYNKLQVDKFESKENPQKAITVALGKWMMAQPESSYGVCVWILDIF